MSLLPAGQATAIQWSEDDASHQALWRSENLTPAPKRVMAVDDRITADAAYKLMCEGTALLWRGDFQNARQLLLALTRRVDRKPRKAVAKVGTKGDTKVSSAKVSVSFKVASATSPSVMKEAFNLHRQAQSQRARILGMLLIPFDEEHVIPLRRAPDVQQACLEAYGPAHASYATSLRELLGLIGAHEWRKKGVPVAALGASIHSHYGVFSPVRGEYVDLVRKAPLPPNLMTDVKALAFDIGTGTGVLAAVLAQRGVAHIIGTDQDPRALACAKENMARLRLDGQIKLQAADLFPQGRAALIVCNPPWIPARPNSAIEHAIYDPDSRMLRGFLHGLPGHLQEGGEAWLILSDIAEHLGLRSRDELLAMFSAAGVKVITRIDARPTHARASDTSDPLHAARAAEVTSLWRLGLE